MITAIVGGRGVAEVSGFGISGQFRLLWTYLYAIVGLYNKNGFFWGSFNPEPLNAPMVGGDMNGTKKGEVLTFPTQARFPSIHFMGIVYSSLLHWRALDCRWWNRIRNGDMMGYGRPPIP